jgi:hypothetical protein
VPVSSEPPLVILRYFLVILAIQARRRMPLKPDHRVPCGVVVEKSARVSRFLLWRGPHIYARGHTAGAVIQRQPLRQNGLRAALNCGACAAGES